MEKMVDVMFCSRGSYNMYSEFPLLLPLWRCSCSSPLQHVYTLPPRVGLRWGEVRVPEKWPGFITTRGRDLNAIPLFPAGHTLWGEPGRLGQQFLREEWSLEAILEISQTSQSCFAFWRRKVTLQGAERSLKWPNRTSTWQVTYFVMLMRKELWVGFTSRAAGLRCPGETAI